MLGAIRARLIAAGMVLADTWEAEIQAWGTLVKLFREYAEGQHRAELTPEMKQMLRVSGTALDSFNLNYCDLVIAKMGDRLTVASVDGDNAAASEWSADVLDTNRFDGLQMDVHDAAIRDGLTFVMVDYSDTEKALRLFHELAWDGTTGMIPIYDRMGKRIVAAVKVWYETETARRVNLYFADRVEKYDESDQGMITPRVDDAAAWRDANGQPVGVPIVPFINRAKARLSFGISELANMIPINDALNRTLVSMVMTAELSAFQIKVAVGFPAPSSVSPGMIIKIAEEGLPDGQKVDMFTLEQAQLVPFISEATFLIDQIGTISQTPLPGQMGADSSSGEALKQREVGLLGKIKRFQVKGGNAWEDVLAVAARVQNAFGSTSAPTVKRWVCKWEDAEIRNDAVVIENAIKVADRVGDEEFLRMIAPTQQWDEAHIQKILAQKRAATANALAALGGNVPGFESFNVA